MRTLKERLEKIAATSAANMPDQTKAVVTAGIRELEASGQVEKALSIIGKKAPTFSLPTDDGMTLSLGLGSGPTVVSFFRGFW